MKRTKLGHRVGAMLLAIVMVLSTLPMTAFAADDETPVSETAEVIETEAPETEAPETEAPETEEPETEPAETEPVETEPAETEPVETEPVETEPVETEPVETEPVETEPVETEPEETVVETTEETVAEETVEETVAELLAEESIEALAEMGTKPRDGRTNGQPFPGGTADSQYFRIPAMVTLNDGTIVAATDARWNTTGDGGGLDTIVSRSTDGGETWNYTFANYLGDNGNKWNGGSTAFIDPALATDGENVYMVVDLFPAGYALNSANKTPPVGETGFDENGNLRLSKNDRSSYDYYLENGKIYDYATDTDQGVSVDAYFNYNVGGVETNLFFSNSAYEVYPTDYLYLTKSTDGGATWSEPTLINAKEANEQVYIVGPGRGLVTSEGDIIFPCYEYTNGTQNASFIYSNDGGETWHRTEDAMADAYRYNGNQDKYTGFSSEAQAVEMNDGTIRMFFRHGWSNVHYVDATRNDDGSYTWGKYASGPAAWGNCQLSAVKYSQLIDGKEAILVSCPTSSSGRQAGKIYVGLDNGNGTMEWKYEYSVNTGDYAYSCLTELKDGSVALLYENGNGTERFETYAISQIAPNATIGEPDGPVVDPPVPPENRLDETVELTVNAVSAEYTQTGNYGTPGTYTTDDGVASYTITQVPKSNGSTAGLGDKVAMNSNGTYTGVISDGTNFLVVDASGNISNTTDVANATKFTVVRSNNGYTIQGNGRYLVANRSGRFPNYTYSLDAQTTSDYWTSYTTTGGFQDAFGTGFTTRNLVFNNGNWALGEGNGNGFLYSVTDGAEGTPGSTTVTFKGLKVGTTTVTLGAYNYNVTVTPKPVEKQVMDVYLLVGGSESFTDVTGNYTAEGSGDGIASVQVQGINNNTSPAEVKQIVDGESYLIRSVRNNNYLLQAETTTQGRTARRLGAQGELWTVSETDAGYSLRALNGSYLDFDNYNNYGANAILSETETSLDLAFSAGNWTIHENINGNHVYLNAYDANSAACYYAADAGSQWKFYSMNSKITNITFVGTAPGDTEVVVGNTTYRIHVSDKVNADNSPVVGGEGEGNGKAVTKLNLTAGVNFDLNLGNGFQGKDVTWTSSNTGIATVDANGVVHGVAAGETTVIATIDGIAYEIPVVVHPNGSGADIDTDGSQHINVYISKIDDTEVFYSLTAIPGSTNNTMSTKMVPTQEGEVFYLNYPNNYKIALDFFGRPDEGYALTRMSSTNSAGDYMALQDKTDPTKCDFYTKSGAAGANQVGSFGATAVQNMMREALKLNCDGGMGFTRGATDTNHLNSDLTFRSEKLPEVDKEVYGLLPKDGKAADFKLYEPGMTAEVGDRIYFKVTVTKNDYQDAVDFADMVLAEQLAGAEFVVGVGEGRPDGTSKTLDNTPIGGTSKTEWDTNPGHTQVLYVGYTVQEKDLDSIIVNTVKLDYQYKSRYSSGTFGGTAEADASITATDFKPRDIVIDFGLPVEIDFSAEIKGNRGLMPQCDAEYGEVSVDERTSIVTYTPSDVLMGSDTVTLTLVNNSNGKKYNPTFKVHPASNVLYEAEDFMMDKENGWTINEYIDQGIQSDKNEACYGFDTAYAGSVGANDSYYAVLQSGEMTSALTTKFHGNAFDLIGACAPDTGIVVVTIKEGNTAKKAAIIDTSFNDSTVGDLHQVPWAHLVLDKVSDYDVAVYGVYREIATNRSTFSAAGAGIGGSLYTAMDALDAEGFDLNKVEYVYFDQGSPLAQMNNSTMMTLAEGDAAAPAAASTTPGNAVYVDGFRVYTETTNPAYAKEEQGLTYTNVLEAVNQTSFAAYVEANANGEWTADTYEGAGGPQNEIYLAYNQGIAFKAPAGSVVQISARAVKGPTAWNGNAVTSNTEMYYKVGVSGVVTIENTLDNGNLLALGNIKSNGLVKMTAADIQEACDKLNAPAEPENVPVYRLYNTSTLEHLLTSDKAEYDRLGGIGWVQEGVAWMAPTEGAPVYRLYNAHTDGHFYTVSEEEKDACVAAGWIEDGVVTYSATPEEGEPIFRMFNPYEEKNYHHYTASSDERDQLVEAGWVFEGIAWYAAKS